MINGDHEELDNNQRAWSVSTTKTWGTMAFQVGLCLDEGGRMLRTN